jgi:polyisoprenoid-binding protein YceI
MVRDGTITIASDPAGCAASAWMDAASLTTGNARRDKSVWSKGFLHVQEYPDVLFVSGRLARDGDRWLLHGKLTVRGTTVPTVLELSSAAPILAAAGSMPARIDRQAYGVGPARHPRPVPRGRVRRRGHVASTDAG